MTLAPSVKYDVTFLKIWTLAPSVKYDVTFLKMCCNYLLCYKLYLYCTFLPYCTLIVPYTAAIWNYYFFDLWRFIVMQGQRSHHILNPSFTVMQIFDTAFIGYQIHSFKVVWSEMFSLFLLETASQDDRSHIKYASVYQDVCMKYPHLYCL